MRRKRELATRKLMVFVGRSHVLRTIHEEYLTRLRKFSWVRELGQNPFPVNLRKRRVSGFLFVHLLITALSGDNILRPPVWSAGRISDRHSDVDGDEDEHQGIDPSVS
jgi:hypothetical protein